MINNNIFNNIIELKKKFEIIKEKGYIENIYFNDKNGGAGKTFENLLGLKRNYSPTPDYKGIEIKTKLFNSKFDITLFSIIPSYDGKLDCDIVKYFVDNFGYVKDTVSDKNILFTYCFATYLNKGNGNFYFWLNVDRNTKRIWLYVFNEKLQIKEKKFYWSFETLQKCLDKKLKYLAYINVNIKKNNDRYFYKYENIEFYSIKNFDNFLKLIENGNIFVCLNIGRYKYGKRKGNVFYHGTRFLIREEKLNRLYEKIDF